MTYLMYWDAAFRKENRNIAGDAYSERGSVRAAQRCLQNQYFRMT
jgi:hypothetical protein